MLYIAEKLILLQQFYEIGTTDPIVNEAFQNGGH